MCPVSGIYYHDVFGGAEQQDAAFTGAAGDGEVKAGFRLHRLLIIKTLQLNFWFCFNIQG